MVQIPNVPTASLEAVGETLLLRGVPGAPASVTAAMVSGFHGAAEVVGTSKHLQGY